MVIRLARGSIAIFVGTAVTACSTVEGPSPRIGTLRAVVRDGTLGSQASTIPTFQVMRWHLDSFSATITGTEGTSTFSFLPLGGCDYRDNVLLRGDLKSQCRGNLGVVLDPTDESVVVFRLDVSFLTATRADRPELAPAGDEDGDGVPNLVDSCRLVPNPEQVASTDFTACAIFDSVSGAFLDSDQDRDGVGDSRDNCLWVANPADAEGVQADTDRDGIGDACAVVVPVALPGAAVHLSCPAGFPSPDGTYIIDFADQTALTCDAHLNSCVLDPAKVVIRPLTVPEEGTASEPCVAIP